MKKGSSKRDLRNWRRRGFRSETVLVKMLKKSGYEAVRIPVSNPSLSPLPDIIGRCGDHVYAFEVKNVEYYAYFPKRQIEKLFRFLDRLIPVPKEFKHAVLAAHMGKKWIYKELSWEMWENSKIPSKERILKRDKGNFKLRSRSIDYKSAIVTILLMIMSGIVSL